MNRMNAKVLKRLNNIHTNIKFTIYLPLDPGPEHTAANISTLHKTLALLRQELKILAFSSKQQKIIEQNVLKLEQELGHNVPGRGIVIFIFDTNEVQSYALPFTVEPALYYGLQNIHLEPLYQHYKYSTPYWVLMISQNGCHLFKGDSTSLESVKDSVLEAGMLTTLRLDETNNPGEQSHRIKAGGQQKSEGFHGQGGFKDMRKKYLQDYFRLMDKQLHTYVANKSEPVLLVGTDNIQALYKKVSNYKHVATSKLSLNSRNISKANLEQLVKPLLDNVLKAKPA